MSSEIYQPEEDSYLLASCIKAIPNIEKKSVLDLGTGSGFQAKKLLSLGCNNVVATDINPKAVGHLKSIFSSEIKEKKIKILKSNLFSSLKGKKFDIILFNPPYLPLDKAEPKSSRTATTGGIHGDEIILKFLKQAKKHLNENGFILLLLSSLTRQDRILSLLKSLGFKKRKIASKKIFFESLYVFRISEK